MKEPDVKTLHFDQDALKKMILEQARHETLALLEHRDPVEVDFEVDKKYGIVKAKIHFAFRSAVESDELPPELLGFDEIDNMDEIGVPLELEGYDEV